MLFKNLFTVLRRYPASVLLNTAGLTVAFAAFLVIVMQVRFEYGFDRGLPGAERVFRVELGWDGSFQTVLNQPLIDHLTDASAHIEAASLFETGNHLDTDFRIERSNGLRDVFRMRRTRATPAIVPTLGLELLEGDSAELNVPDRVLIPASMARKMFPGERAAGHKLIGEGFDLTVGGVYRDFPVNSVFPNSLIQGHPWKNSRDNSNYMFFVRLDDPAADDDVRQAMNRIVRAFYEIPADAPEAAAAVRLVNVRDIYFEHDVRYESLSPKGNRTTTDILLAIALLVIAIAAINFINFASALAPLRMKMMNLQKILGAGVRQLRLSLLFEAAVIALAAYVLALWVVAALAATPFAQYVSADISPGANASLAGWGVFAALGTGLLAGLYPAVYMTSFRPILAIRGSFGTSASGRRYRIVLVGLQYVISLTLIVAALFVNLQNRHLTRLDLGFDKEQVAVVTLTQDLLAHRDRLVERLKSDAAVENVAFALQKFGADEANYMGWGRDYKDLGQISFKCLPVSEEFLRTLGIPVAEGRDFSPADALRAPGTYIFNRKARELYAMELGDFIEQTQVDATGQHTFGWGEIVGFIPDSVRLYSQHRSEDPIAFFLGGTLQWSDVPAASTMHYCYIRIAAGADPLAAARRIVKTVCDLSPFGCDIEFMDTVVNSLYRSELRSGVLITAFSVLAILVSLMGVFGLVLFETQYRRKEIGIRKVNGATSASILGMFNRRFAAIVLASFAVAAPLAWWGVGAWLSNFRSAVPRHAWVFAAALAVVLLITAVTVTLRSWHTANENPVDSVKTE